MSYPEPEQTPMGWAPPVGAPSGYGGGPPPPGSPMAPVARRRRWPWIVLGVVVLAVIAVGGCTALVLRATRPSIDAANEWLVLVDEQRWDEAYATMCEPTRVANEQAEVEAVLADDFGAGIDDYRIDRYQLDNGAVSVGGQITVGGDERPIALAMTNDVDEGWQVCQYGFNDLDAGG